MIVGLGHRAQVGKDTAAGFLVKRGFVRLAFADILKDVAYDLNPIVIPALVQGRLQDLVDERGWEAAKELGEVRRLLQELGVAARWHLGENVWVQPIFNKILDQPDQDFVVTDVRFPNEFTMLKSMRLNPAVMVKITREAVGNAGNHSSEISLVDAEWDEVVLNDGTIAEFEENLLGVLGLPHTCQEVFGG